MDPQMAYVTEAGAYLGAYNQQQGLLYPTPWFNHASVLNQFYQWPSTVNSTCQPLQISGSIESVTSLVSVPTLSKPQDQTVGAAISSVEQVPSHQPDSDCVELLAQVNSVPPPSLQSDTTLSSVEPVSVIPISQSDSDSVELPKQATVVPILSQLHNETLGAILQSDTVVPLVKPGSVIPSSRSDSELPEQVSYSKSTAEPLTIQNAFEEGQVAYRELLFSK